MECAFGRAAGGSLHGVSIAGSFGIQRATSSQGSGPDGSRAIAKCVQHKAQKAWKPEAASNCAKTSARTPNLVRGAMYAKVASTTCAASQLGHKSSARQTAGARVSLSDHSTSQALSLKLSTQHKLLWSHGTARLASAALAVVVDPCEETTHHLPRRWLASKQKDRDSACRVGLSRLWGKTAQNHPTSLIN